MLAAVLQQSTPGATQGGAGSPAADVEQQLRVAQAHISHLQQQLGECVGKEGGGVNPSFLYHRNTMSQSTVSAGFKGDVMLLALK